MSIGEDTRKLRRRALLVEAGKQATRAVSAYFEKHHKIANAIRFNADAPCLDMVVDAYFEQVVSFKERNDFRNGDLINFSKIAGLFTIIILDRKSIILGQKIDPLFILADGVPNSAYEQFLIPFFIYRLIGSILSLDLTRISGEIENDLMRCLTLHPQIQADADWLFWSFKVLQIAYGNPALSAPDPLT